MKLLLDQSVDQGKDIEEMKINMPVMVQSVMAQGQEGLLYHLNQKNHKQNTQELPLIIPNSIRFTY
jgi:hypothetical protein